MKGNDMREYELREKIRSIIHNHGHDFNPFSEASEGRSDTTCRKCTRDLLVTMVGTDFSLSGAAVDTNCVVLEIVVNRGRSKEV